MSRTAEQIVQRSLGDRIMLAYPCARCGARVHDWCRTRSGRVAINLHASRFWQATADGKLPLRHYAKVSTE
jgi:hypothetical protein